MENFTPTGVMHAGYEGNRAWCIALAARAAHEANRAWCIALGDHSQPEWELAPAWQREGAIKGVQAILENPSITPVQLHDEWLAVKRAAGWTYGPEKDPEAKTHPCYRPYAELPTEQRAKDTIFGAVVRAMLYAAKALPTTVSKAEIDTLLSLGEFTDQRLGQKTTVVHVTMPNGFEMTETSACVDPANYNHAMGVGICMRKIADRLWALEGYRLQCAIGKG